MTQTEQVKAHLEQGLPITPLEALRRYGCFRLGARIWELRQEGMPIEREMIEDAATGKHFAQYRLGRTE